jgi:hypothetical protein
MSHTFDLAQLLFSVVFVGRFHNLTFLYTIKNNASGSVRLTINLLLKAQL